MLNQSRACKSFNLCKCLSRAERWREEQSLTSFCRCEGTRNTAVNREIYQITHAHEHGWCQLYSSYLLTEIRPPPLIWRVTNGKTNHPLTLCKKRGSEKSVSNRTQQLSIVYSRRIMVARPTLHPRPTI